MLPENTPPVLEQPVQRLLSLLGADGPRRMIALAGLPGAGKSTLAARLAAEVNAQAGPGAMAVLGMDGFHLSRAALERLPDPDAALARRGAPWTFDPDALAQRLHDVRAGAGRAAVSWPGFDHGVGDPVEGAELVPPAARLVLVEGLYLLYTGDGWEAVRGAFEELWYLDTPLELAMDRLARRHRTAWGMSREAAEARIAANDRLNAEIVRATRADADWWLRH
jgi:pantothenate kinase